MKKRKNIEIVEEILIDAPKLVKKQWKKVKKAYKNKKHVEKHKLKTVKSFLLGEFYKYSKSRKRSIVKAWKHIRESCKA